MSEKIPPVPINEPEAGDADVDETANITPKVSITRTETDTSKIEELKNDGEAYHMLVAAKRG
jgi:hypothetical protein